jgi:hypothetical protein
MDYIINTMAQQTVIKFNIGGTRYEVSQSLLQSYPDSMLAKSAAEQWHTDPDSEIFIDRDGARFQYVLDYLRDGAVQLPVVVTRASILSDLRFYTVAIKEEAIVEKLDASHFSKYISLVQDVLKSWVQEKNMLENRNNILEGCIRIMRAFRLQSQAMNTQDLNTIHLESVALCGRSFTDCNDELRKVGLRVETESNKHHIKGGTLVCHLTLGSIE